MSAPERKRRDCITLITEFKSMKNKIKIILTWFVQVIMGLEFILAGQAKFTRPEVWAKEFREWGYPDHLYLIIGGLELVGAILIFFPKFATRAALGLGVIMSGATITHAIHQEWNRVVVTVVITGLLGLVFYLRRNYK